MPTRAIRTRAVARRAPGAVLLGLLLLWVTPCSAVSAPALDFLYIDSAVDEAAGGHTAARLGDAVFHYQYFSDGLFLLVNDRWEGFRYRYNDLQNRSVTRVRVPLSRESFDRIQSHLFMRYVLQEHRLQRFDQLTGEFELLQRLAAGEDSLPLEGLGFFSLTQAVDPDALELRNLVAGRLGAGWLASQLHEAALDPGTVSFRSDASDDDPDGTAARTGPLAGWSVVLRERLSLREALVLLFEARGLADDALLPAATMSEALSAGERAAAEQFRGQLADSVLNLLASNRPDRGSALLLQMARYLALSRSLASGALCTLDPFPDAMQRAAPESARASDSGADALGDAREELAAFRGVFVAEPALRMTAYSRIEAAQGRVTELERALRLHTPVRFEADPLLPRRSRAVRAGLQGSPAAFAQAARAAALRRDDDRKDLENTFSYNLFTRNCSTEIVRDINESFGSRELAQELLGGALEPGERLSFVPFRLPGAVRGAFASPESEFLPSYRLRQLERLYRQEGPLVWLRENNTLTSSLYTPSWAEDSVFLFFTDDVVAPRPLLGALNLLYATAHAAGGLLLAPVDRGKLLSQSLRGMLYSLPEIAFFNIRKGSYRSVPQEPAESP